MRRVNSCNTQPSHWNDGTQDSAGVAYLVDDDKAVRHALAGFLHASGVAVVSFGSAADYLQHPRTDASACLILDLQLPDISGLDLQRRLIDEMGPPIIFISGRGDVRSTVQAMKAGALEFLTKPINPEALIATVAAGFERDRLNRRKRAEIAGLQRRFSLLSPREREVLPLVVGGLLNKQSAAALGIAEVTLQIHRSRIMQKMLADSFADLVRMAEKLRSTECDVASWPQARLEMPLRDATNG
jgi:FixJ family two-component response regulator